MASFLVRALDLPAGTATFTDTADSIHAADIAALATAGITKGCNPPTNTRYCPTSTVTREQMASFLTRALDLPAATSTFTDIGDSVHAADIGALAAAGITKGCNPPDNTRYCPKNPVTREQMASFLTRALNLTPIPPPPPLPDVSPSAAGRHRDRELALLQRDRRPVVPDRQRLRPGRCRGRQGEGRCRGIRSLRSSTPSLPTRAASTAGRSRPAIGTDRVRSRTPTELRAAFATAADPARVELWDVFDADSRQLHFKHDTHWNGDGALLGSEHIATLAAPGVWSGMDMVPTPAARQGDLADLIGVPWVVTYGDPVPTLPGVTPTVTVESASIAGRPLVSYDSPSNPGLSSVPTAVIHDSYGLFFRNKLGPLFEDVTFVPNFSHPITDDARPFVESSDQIVLEVVERNALRDFIGTGTAGHLAATLADDFAQTPVTYNRIDGKTRSSSHSPSGFEHPALSRRRGRRHIDGHPRLVRRRSTYLLVSRPGRTRSRRMRAATASRSWGLWSWAMSCHYRCQLQ